MIADKDEHIKTILSVIPEKPGCYQYFDENGTIIYVGKAKKLKNRVSSYFHGEHLPKVAAMVEKVRDFNVIVAGSEFEALVLENSCVSQANPGYQIYSRRYGRRRVTTGKQPHQTVSSPL